MLSLVFRIFLIGVRRQFRVEGECEAPLTTKGETVYCEQIELTAAQAGCFELLAIGKRNYAAITGVDLGFPMPLIGPEVFNQIAL